MAGSSGTPRPPAGLAGRGRALWSSVQESYELDAVETQLLVELCRTLDCCDSIRAELARGESLLVTGSTGQPRVSPLLTALEGQTKLADRLAGSLALSMPGEAGRGRAHQRKAARRRWSRATGSVTPIAGGA